MQNKGRCRRALLRSSIGALGLLSACADLPVVSRDARSLGERAGYPSTAYPITSTFRDPHDSRGIRRRTAHAGVDIRAPSGTPVVAAAAGSLEVLTDPGAGAVILLRTVDTPGPLLLEFAHLEQVLVRTGETVTRGQTIATVGRSGRESGGLSHLHFAVARPDGALLDPVPLLFGAGAIVCAEPGDAGAGPPVRGVVAGSGAALVYPVACVAP